MNNYPEYVEIEKKRYKINTDFRYAIECNRIAEDETIGEYERALAVIYTLFGEEGIDCPEHYEKLLEMAKKYLSCGKEINLEHTEEPDMDFMQDMDFIEASFMSDYHIDLTSTKMHWWKFFNLIGGLSNSELGDCCILNRIRNLRNLDTKEIKDAKTREKLEEQKKRFSLKSKPLTKEQEESSKEFRKLLGMERE